MKKCKFFSLIVNQAHQSLRIFTITALKTGLAFFTKKLTRTLFTIVYVLMEIPGAPLGAAPETTLEASVNVAPRLPPRGCNLFH